MSKRNVLFSYPLKTSENQRFFNVFKGHRNVKLGKNGLIYKYQFQVNTKSKIIPKSFPVFIGDVLVSLILALNWYFFTWKTFLHYQLDESGK